jgi:predicted aspartyl protease
MRSVTDDIFAFLRGITALIAAILCVFALAARHGESVSGNAETPRLASENDPDEYYDRRHRNQFEWLAPEGEYQSRGDVGAEIIEPDNILEEFDIAGNGDHILVPVTIGGKKVQFLVDTGSTYCVVDIGLRSNLIRTETTTAVNGVKRFEVYQLCDVYVGESRLPVTGETVCLEVAKLCEGVGDDVQGILGMNFLGRHVIHIDFDAGKLFILKTSPKLRHGAFRLGYRSQCPTLDVEIFRGGGVPFLVDTGMSGGCAAMIQEWTREILLHQGRLVPLKQLGTLMTIDGEERQREARLDRLCVGQYEHTHVLIGVDASDNLLGLQYLLRYTVTFDFPSDLVYLFPGKRFAQPTLYNMSGMRLARAGNDTLVEKVFHDSPATAAGIRAADRLLLIDGKCTSELSLSEVCEQLRDEGRCVRLVIQGADEPREVELVPSDYQRKDPERKN